MTEITAERVRELASEAYRAKESSSNPVHFVDTVLVAAVRLGSREGLESAAREAEAPK